MIAYSEKKDIVKLDSKDYIKFTNIINNIKKAEPIKRGIPVSDNSFFEKVFTEKVEYEDTQIDGYITIAKFCEMLYGFYDLVDSKLDELIRKSSLKHKIFAFNFESYHSFIIFYKTLCLVEKYLQIDIRNFPDLEKGNLNVYELYKEEIFKVVPFIKLYYKLFDNYLGRCEIKIKDDVNLKIDLKEKKDLLEGKYPNIKLQISDLAMIELSKDKGFISYSDDVSILTSITGNEENLFHSCYMSDECKVMNIIRKAQMLKESL